MSALDKGAIADVTPESSQRAHADDSRCPNIRRRYGSLYLRPSAYLSIWMKPDAKQNTRESPYLRIRVEQSRTDLIVTRVALCWNCDNARPSARTSMVRRGRRFESDRGLRKGPEPCPDKARRPWIKRIFCWVDSAV